MTADEDPTVERVDWVEQERAHDGPLRELRRLGHRARIRWPLTLLGTLALTAVVVVAAARQGRVYTSRIAFSIHESSVHAAPGSNRRLRDYVAEGVFSRAHLVAVMQEHNLYPSLRERDPRRAVEEMRDDLEIDVWRNDSARRHTTRLAVTYRGEDREQVFAVVQHLGRLISGQEQGTGLQKRARGASWELVDAGHVAPPGMGRGTLLGILGLVAFLLSLPLAAIVVGTADPRIYDLDDVRRLGMPTVGAVRRFEGDNAGALAERLEREGPPADGRRGRMGSS